MILNLTQHQATEEQRNQGVVDLPTQDRIDTLKRLLTFDELPTKELMNKRAKQIVLLVRNNGISDTFVPAKVMIAGAPFFMSILEKALLNDGIQPVYAFSVRDGVEQIQQDGSVRKINVFKHIGFVEV